MGIVCMMTKNIKPILKPVTSNKNPFQRKTSLQCVISMCLCICVSLSIACIIACDVHVDIYCMFAFKQMQTARYENDISDIP